MPRIDFYRHLNDETGSGVTIGIEEIAVQVEAQNYGMHRMLSALVRAREARRPADPLATELRALLEKGLF
jgi:hypothetical protein